MLQTLLWISRLEKTFGKNSSKSGQKYFAKCASYTSNYIESKSASINLFFPIYYLVHQMQHPFLKLWILIVFPRKKSVLMKIVFLYKERQLYQLFFYHCFHSQTEVRFEQIKFYVTNSGFVDTRLVFSIWRISYLSNNLIFLFCLFQKNEWKSLACRFHAGFCIPKLPRMFV